MLANQIITIGNEISELEQQIEAKTAHLRSLLGDGTLHLESGLPKEIIKETTKEKSQVEKKNRRDKYITRALTNNGPMTEQELLDSLDKRIDKRGLHMVIRRLTEEKKGKLYLK